ncbi:hypothetical protein LCGC14_1283690 [marine sediment metagenome]|uniref:Uncharacterized protein n=1 Tax=marine sediment metagenome TaxID=412755 RepID=A0A0F9KUH8_9ZZZZ
MSIFTPAPSHEYVRGLGRGTARPTHPARFKRVLETGSLQKTVLERSFRIACGEEHPGVPRNSFIGDTQGGSPYFLTSSPHAPFIGLSAKIMRLDRVVASVSTEIFH